MRVAIRLTIPVTSATFVLPNLRFLFFPAIVGSIDLSSDHQRTLSLEEGEK